MWIADAVYGPQPQPPPQHPPPPPLNGGNGPIEVGISLEPPLVTDAKTEIARLAGCSQLGQSAPVEVIDCSFSNLWSQVGQRYSYRGMFVTLQYRFQTDSWPKLFTQQTLN